MRARKLRRLPPEVAWGIAIAVLAGGINWLGHRLPPPTSSDIDQVWVAARALLHGHDPYEAVLAARRHSPVGYPLGFPLYYPLPAVLLLGPLAPLPIGLARAIWAGVGAGLLAAAGFRYRRGLVVALLSASFLNAVLQGQWSTYLTAAAVLPWLGFVWVAKPSVSAAMFAGYPSRAAIVGGMILLALSLVVAHGWPAEWLRSVRGAELVPPIARPGGALLLLALLRWRLPEARMLAALACVPQTLGLYETLPLFLIPRSRWGGYLLATSSYVLAVWVAVWHPKLPGQHLVDTYGARWPGFLALLYLPALVMLFFRHGLVEQTGRRVEAPDTDVEPNRAGTREVSFQ